MHNNKLKGLANKPKHNAKMINIHDMVFKRPDST
jgi:hypothetical protein